MHVVPVGGYTNVLTLQRDLLRGNVLGVGREIISILDGDIINNVPKEFSNLKKIFLPIKSIEKFLYSIAIENTNPALKKTINDKYFQLDSLDSLVAEHNDKYKGKVDQPDKKFYYRLRKNLEARGIDELMFAQKLSDDIMREISFEKFSNNIETMLTK